jgi:hypothetical protein
MEALKAELPKLIQVSYDVRDYHIYLSMDDGGVMMDVDFPTDSKVSKLLDILLYE